MLRRLFVKVNRSAPFIFNRFAAYVVFLQQALKQRIGNGILHYHKCGLLGKYPVYFILCLDVQSLPVVFRP